MNLSHSNWLRSNRQTRAVASQTQTYSVKYDLKLMGLQLCF